MRIEILRACALDHCHRKQTECYSDDGIGKHFLEGEPPADEGSSVLKKAAGGPQTVLLP